MATTTFERVQKIIVEQLGVEPEEVYMSSAFMEDLGADSIDVIELIMAFEEEFDIEIPDEKIERTITVGDIVNYLTPYEEVSSERMKRVVSEDYVKQRMQKSGRKIKRTGD